jgi:hypothetical protein
VIGSASYDDRAGFKPAPTKPSAPFNTKMLDH